MTNKSNFEGIFYSQCELLGEDYQKLIDRYGEYDDISTNEHGTKFIYFQDLKTNFCVNRNNLVTCMNVPVVDAEGNRLPEFSKQYAINGIYQGMTHMEVMELLGESDIKSNRGDELDAIFDKLHWSYKSNIKHSNSGSKYIIRYFFEDVAGVDEESEYRLATFHVDLLEQYSATVKAQSNSNKGCFIATACFGNFDAKEVILFRKYRDEVLIKHNVGKLLIRIYYWVGPSLAKSISKSEYLKQFVRIQILNPILRYIYKNS